MEQGTNTCPWLPEPQVQGFGHNPIERVEQDETINYAFLVLLQKLSAMERAVFILRDVLGYEYGEIAEMLQKSEGNCRKIYSRAKSKIGHDEEGSSRVIGETGPLTQLFLQAVNTGDFNALVTMLREDAVLVSDGGGKRRAAIRPILGKERIFAFFTGIVAKGSLRGEWRPLTINCQAGLLLKQQGKPAYLICFNWHAESEQAKEVYLYVNPEKLEKLNV
jgi:RNA polymerase sigma-70 factor (ECF subfamily)